MNYKIKKTAAIIGTQWGDEGKGKITDFFAQKADVIVRWSGGNNAGHTIVFEGKKYQLSVVPSGIFNQKVINIIANGCVVNLEKLVSEISYLKKHGFHCDNLKISDRAHVIFPYHLTLDHYEESSKKVAIGTTKKGVGPCLADKVNRIGIRIGDLLDEKQFKIKLHENVERKNKILKYIYHAKEQFDAEKIFQHINSFIMPIIKNYICDTAQLLQSQISKGNVILFEGAQGTMLDIDHGTYPFVTSSNPIASSIATGTGIGLHQINQIIGVTKAYNTRVGAGVFPTEFEDETSEKIREVGKEYGTVSKRPRRIGWFDAVIARYSAQINGFTGLAITLLDVLSGIETLKICTSYQLNQKTINHIPSQIDTFEQCQPQYITLPGWKEDISQITNYRDLPENAKNYLQKISELVGVPITLFSVGPDRTQTILLEFSYD